jgi:large subunit ribosomal protein L21
VPTTRAHLPIEKQPIAPSFTAPLQVTRSLMSQLPHLAGQKPHYVVAQLHAKPYLLTEGDHLRLPFLMPNVKAGDILRFNRASALGSRDFTMKGAPHIDERIYECRVRVTGVESEPLRIKEKTKRRQRHVKQAKSKHRYTIMRVMDVRVKTPDELLEEGAIVVEDGEDSSVIEPRS